MNDEVSATDVDTVMSVQELTKYCQGYAYLEDTEELLKLVMPIS